MRLGALAFLLTLLFALIGCGGDGTTFSSALRVSPSDTGALINSTVTLTAFTSGGEQRGTVDWSVIGGSANGSVSSQGVYTAPGSPGTYQVRAVLREDPDVQATATIRVSNAVTLTISPTTVKERYRPSDTIQFDKTVTGTSSEDVTWIVLEPSGGSITQTGLYKAPSTPGQYTVQLRSTRYSNKIGTYKVLVSDNRVVKLSIAGKGDMYIRMDDQNTPITASNFVNLAGSGFYDGVYFHRYGPDENLPQFIQGGDPNTKTLPLSDPSIGTGGPGYTINFESNPNKHLAGSIAMARSQDINSAGSQFYICNVAIPDFDGNYVVFGRVLAGYDILAQLRRGDKIDRAAVVP